MAKIDKIIIGKTREENQRMIYNSIPNNIIISSSKGTYLCVGLSDICTASLPAYLKTLVDLDYWCVCHSTQKLRSKPFHSDLEAVWSQGEYHRFLSMLCRCYCYCSYYYLSGNGRMFFEIRSGWLEDYLGLLNFVRRVMGERGE